MGKIAMALWSNTRRTIVLLALLMLGTLIWRPAPCQSASPAAAKFGPDLRVVMGVLKPGTNIYSTGLELCQVVNTYTNLKMIVQPYPTSMGTFAYVKSGAVQVAFIPVENVEAYAFGIETLANPEKKAANPELRLLMGGYHLYVAWITRRDTGIKTIPDLKGRKIFWRSAAGFSNRVYAEDSLRAFGLDPDKDVTSVVGYENVPASYKAVQTRKIDALFGPLGGAQMEELEAAAGCVVLPFPKEKQNALRISTKVVVSLPPNYFPGIKEPLSVIGRKQLLFTHKNLPDEAAYAIVKSIVEHHEDLGTGPELREWGKEYAMPSLTNIVIPFHPGAAKYMKEIGLWTQQVEARNKEVLERILKVKP